MSEMVERVARAICATIPGTGNVDEHFSPPNRAAAQEWYKIARAAIEAMREPTPEMYDAVSDSGKMWRETNSAEVYRTMIAGALNEKVVTP